MKRSFLRNISIISVIVGLLFGCASPGSQRVSPRLHPNLAAAQAFIERALDKLTAAQEANGFDMDGHAAKAKVLLERAYSEIKLAALAANAHR